MARRPLRGGSKKSMLARTTILKIGRLEISWWKPIEIKFTARR